MPYETDDNGYGDGDEYDGNLSYMDDQQQDMRVEDSAEDSDLNASKADSGSEAEAHKTSDSSTVDSSEGRNVEEVRNRGDHPDESEEIADRRAMDKSKPSNGMAKPPQNLRESVEKLEMLLKTGCTQSDIMQKRLPKDLKEILKKCPKYFREAQDESLDESVHLKEKYNMLVREMQKKYESDVKAVLQQDSPNGQKHNVTEYLLDMQMTYGNLLNNSAQIQGNGLEEVRNDCPENIKNIRKKFVNGVRKVKKNRNPKNVSKVSLQDNEKAATIYEECSEDVNFVEVHDKDPDKDLRQNIKNETGKSKEVGPEVSSNKLPNNTDEIFEVSPTSSGKVKKVSFADSNMIKVCPDVTNGSARSRGDMDPGDAKNKNSLDRSKKKTDVEYVNSKKIRDERLHKNDPKKKKSLSGVDELKKENFSDVGDKEADGKFQESREMSFVGVEEGQKEYNDRKELAHGKKKPPVTNGINDKRDMYPVVTGAFENAETFSKSKKDLKMMSLESGEITNLTKCSDEFNDTTKFNDTTEEREEISSSLGETPSHDENVICSNNIMEYQKAQLNGLHSPVTADKKERAVSGKKLPCLNDVVKEPESGLNNSEEINVNGPHDSKEPVNLHEECGRHDSATEKIEMGGDMLKETLYLRHEENSSVGSTEDQALSAEHSETDAVIHKAESVSEIPGDSSGKKGDTCTDDLEDNKSDANDEEKVLSVPKNNSSEKPEFLEPESEILSEKFSSPSEEAAAAVTCRDSEAPIATACESEQVDLMVIRGSASDEHEISAEDKNETNNSSSGKLKNSFCTDSKLESGETYNSEPLIISDGEISTVDDISPQTKISEYSQEEKVSFSAVSDNSREIKVLDCSQITDVSQCSQEPEVSVSSTISENSRETDVSDCSQETKVSHSSQETKMPDSSQETKVSDSLQETKVADSLQETKMPDSSQETKVSDSSQETKMSDSSQETKVADSLQDTKVADSLQDTKVADSLQKTKMPYSSQETKVSDSLLGTKVSDRSQETNVADSSQDTKVSESLQETKVADSSQEIKVSDSSQETIASDSLHEIKVSDSSQETVASDSSPETKEISSDCSGSSSPTPEILENSLTVNLADETTKPPNSCEETVAELSLPGEDAICDNSPEVIPDRLEAEMQHTEQLIFSSQDAQTELKTNPAEDILKSSGVSEESVFSSSVSEEKHDMDDTTGIAMDDPNDDKECVVEKASRRQNAQMKIENSATKEIPESSSHSENAIAASQSPEEKHDGDEIAESTTDNDKQSSTQNLSRVQNAQTESQITSTKEAQKFLNDSEKTSLNSHASDETSETTTDEANDPVRSSARKTPDEQNAQEELEIISEQGIPKSSSHLKKVISSSQLLDAKYDKDEIVEITADDPHVEEQAAQPQMSRCQNVELKFGVSLTKIEEPQNCLEKTIPSGQLTEEECDSVKASEIISDIKLQDADEEASNCQNADFEEDIRLEVSQTLPENITEDPGKLLKEEGQEGSRNASPANSKELQSCESNNTAENCSKNFNYSEDIRRGEPTVASPKDKHKTKSSESDKKPDNDAEKDGSVKASISPAQSIPNKTSRDDVTGYPKSFDESAKSQKSSNKGRKPANISTTLSTKTVVSLQRPKNLKTSIASRPLKHICPHRRKGSPKVGDGQHTKLCTEYQSNFAELSRGGGTPDKKWKSSQEYVTHVHRSHAQNGHKENDVAGDQSEAKTVSPKGNGRGPLLSVGNTSWSSRQVPKTMSMRRPDNLKAEGSADFTTTHQQDFTQKKTQAAEISTSEAPSALQAETKSQSWNNRQVRKTQAIKRPDNLKPAGPFHFDTSYGDEYTRKRIESQERAEGPVENVPAKRSSHRPKTSLKSSGEFHSESSYHEAYTAKTAERPTVSTVTKREAPFAQMESETDVQERAIAAEDGQAEAGTTDGAQKSSLTVGDSDQGPRKARSLRPPTTLKSEGTFASSTVNQDVYKPIKTEKTKPIKPKTSYKLEGKFEGESTLISDYKKWDAKRHVVGKPKDQLAPEGSIDFTTTSRAEYHPIEVDKTKSLRPPTTTKLSGEFQDTTTTSDYKQWHVKRPSRKKPEDNLKPDGEIDFNEHLRNVEYSEATGPSARSYYNRVKRPQDHDLLGASDGQFESETSYGDFKRWKVSRPVVRKPTNNLTQEGDLSFATTQASDYVMREGDAEIAGQEQLALDTIEEYAEYPGHPEMTGDRRDGEIVMDQRNEEQLVQTEASRVPDGKGDSQETLMPEPKVSVEEHAATPEGETTDRGEYYERLSPKNLTNAVEERYDQYESRQREDAPLEEQYVTWDQVRPKPIRPKSNLRQEGGMEFSTTNQDEFVAVASERVKEIRPKTNTQITGKFDDTTTNQVMYQYVDGERVNPIMPKNNLHVEDGTFNSETTSGREFQNWKVGKPAAIRQKENIRTEGDMEFTTTHSAEFEEKHAERSKLTRPQTNTKLSKEEFQKTTTNQVMHPGYQPDKVQSIKPVTNLKPSSGKFIDDTTNKREFQNWVPDRQAPIRPTESMRQEGEMDFTTMNQIDFEEKTAEKVSQIRPHTSSKITGEFDGTTTNQVMFKSLPAEKANKILPSPNLRLETGEFQDETMAKREFQQWPYVKPQPFLPKNNITSEGNVEYTTVSQEQYGPKQMDRVKGLRPKTSTQISGDFDGTTTNQVMFQNTPGERAHEIRPSSNLHLEGGQFFDETTANREFQNWEHSKPSPIRPKGNITQEGNFDFTTTNQTQFEGKTAERISEIRPKTSSKITGDFDGTTTNQVMFQSMPSERVHGIRPQTNIQLNRGNFSNETTANREFQNWGYSKPDSLKPKNNLYQEGGVDYITTNQIEFERRSGQKASSMRPKTNTRLEGEFDRETMNQMMFKNIPPDRAREIRPKHNIELERGGFQGETTANREFQRWQVSKPAAIYPKGNLTQDGEIDFTTSNQMEYQQKHGEKANQLRPHTSTKITGDFEGTTTNQVMFRTPHMEKVHDIRPRDNLHLERGKFEGETTNNREYHYRAGKKPAQIKHKPTLEQEGSMDFTTSNQIQFAEKPISRVEQMRPQTTAQMGGEFYGTTTNQTMFQVPKMEMVREVRPQPNIHLEGGKFENTTSTGQQFQQWQIDRPAAIRPVGTLRQEGDMQFETTNMSEFFAKGQGKAQQTRPKTSTKIEGTFDGTTTNQTMFTGAAVDRVQPIRQENNLHVEKGKFYDETTTGREYRQWVKVPSKVTQQINEIRQDIRAGRKHQNRHERKQITKDLYRPKTTPESEMTSMGKSTGQSVSKQKKIKPTDNLKSGGEHFMGGVSQLTEHKPWKVNNAERPATEIIDSSKTEKLPDQADIKPTRSKKTKQKTAAEVSESRKALSALEEFEQRPSDGSPRRSDIESVMQVLAEQRKTAAGKESTVKMSDHRKSQGQQLVSTVMADYGAKPVARVKAIIPEGNLKQEGAMDFSTTSRVDYTGKQITEVRQSEEVSDVEQGKQPLSEETEEQAYEPWRLAKSEESNKSKVKKISPELPRKPVVHMRGKHQELTGDLKETHVSDQQSETKKHRKRFKPDDNLKAANVPFDADSTTRTEYRKVEGRKSSSKKRSQTLKPEGDMQFSTTTSEDYTLKGQLEESERVKMSKQQKPQNNLKQTGEMDFATTTSSSYLGNSTPKTKSLRPKSTLRFGDRGSPRGKASPISSRKQSPSGIHQSDITSTTKAAYTGHEVTERTRINRPPTVQKVGSGSFQETTTSKSAYGTPPKSVERTHLYKPENHHILDGGNDFYGNTTYRCSFEAMKIPQCPVVEIEAGKSNYTFKEEVNGHQFYLPLVEG